MEGVLLMRRDINIRKKKQIISRNNNNQKLSILSISITLLIVLLTTFLFFSKDFLIKKNLEKGSIDFSNLNEKIPFSIQKIILFSSATATSDSVNQLLTLDISQYCDIGIYLNKSNDENILISSLYIDNIVLSSPEIGTPYLYKKNIKDLGKCTFNEKNIIKDSLHYNVINTDNEIKYENYEIYNDSTTPLSIGFYNKNIKTKFFPDDSEILYNGTLLKYASIPYSSLNCSISFRLNIVTTSNEHYICNITLEIPFEDNNGSIYDTGYITKELNSNELNKFIRIK